VAFELAKIIAEKGHGYAQFLLGLCYISGDGVNEDRGKAFELFKSFTEESDKYLSEIKVNKQKDFEYSKIFTETMNIGSKYSLGYCYNKGFGTEVNKTKAFEYYKKLADQEYLNAQFELAYCHDVGSGVEVDKIKAFELYKIAANKGHETAQNNLGILYEHGEGVGKDLKLAIYWYDKAARNGSKVALYNLGKCYQRWKWYRKRWGKSI